MVESAPFTLEECQKFLASPNLNPRTNRLIKQDGPLSKKLSERCIDLMVDRNRDKNLGSMIDKGASSKKLPISAFQNTTPSFLSEDGNQIFWQSLPYLKRILPQFENSQIPIEKHFTKPIKVAIDSFRRPKPLHRTLEDLDIPSSNPYHQIATSSLIRDLSLYNCHDGQKKLTMSLLEFLSLAMEKLKCTDKDILVIYAGSSGRASAVALNVFPDIQIALYDPDANTLTQMPPSIKNSNRYMTVYRQTNQVAQNLLEWRSLMVFTGKAGWFTDQTAEYIRQILFPLSKRKHLLFVSDIREEATEEKIVQDMKSQMRWTLVLNADAYMFKFRLPYTERGHLPRNIKMMYQDLSHLNRKTGTSQNLDTRQNLDSIPTNKAMASHPNTILYLEGEMFLQIYAPQRTTELRLIGFKNQKKYKLCFYDAAEIENKMAVFNTIFRPYVLYVLYASNENSDEEGNKKTIIASSYENLSEYLIIRSCARMRRNKDETAAAPSFSFSFSLEDVIRELYDKIGTMMREVDPRKTDKDRCKYLSASSALSALSSMKGKNGSPRDEILVSKTPKEYKSILYERGIVK